MKKDKPLSRKGLWASIVVLLLGMTLGFILLSTVYTGPSWVRVAVFIVYIAVVLLLIRSVRRLDSYLKDKEREEKDGISGNT